ncbi:MAG: hypothetical protein ACYCVD_15000 [Desulfitobacteriaceae bacterium]
MRKITNSRQESCKSRGYILFDALLAIFLFSFGFAALYGLTEGTLWTTRQAAYLTEGANYAQKHLESLAAHKWEDNLAQGKCIPGGLVEGDDGNFHWLIRSDWDPLPDLLRISVEVRWLEDSHLRSYLLESAYHVE